MSQPIPALSPNVPAVVTNSLSKQFGRFSALRNVTAEFAAGRLYVILGENGAGKSTLLRAVAGLARPSRGTITVLGSPDIRAVAHQIGYMSHPSLLYDEMGGLENLLYFSQLYGMGAHDNDKAFCAQVITTVGLDPELTRTVGQYSQGMRQRMSLARALINNPQLLLLDEPFSNVDAASARAMVKLLATLRDAGKTVFVVTHQPSLLESAANEFIWMLAGQIERRSATFAEGQP